ncbi:MAG: penicillin acylase family protein, partial [Candidatus Hydrogenedentales bacterium]
MHRILLGFACAAAAAGWAPAEIVTLYLDDYGIPHIYAESAEAGLYAQGWAMARDRLDQTLSNYLRGMGRFAEAHGSGDNESDLRGDLESLMWDHYGV